MEKAINRAILVITERFYPERFLINDLVSQVMEDGVNVQIGRAHV